MRRFLPGNVLVVAASAALVAGLALLVRSGRVPLGVPGEWEWLRVRHGPSLLRFLPATGPFGLPTVVGILPALAALGLYAAVALAGAKALARRAGAVRESVALLALVVAAVLAQAGIQDGAPEGYGLEKWIVALDNPGSSGYLTVAREQMGDLPRFLADYPDWIARQDALHVGTHPPGLFVASRWIRDRMERHPGLARWTLDHAPPTAAAMARILRDGGKLAPVDAATLTALGALTLLACSLAAVPTYALARASGLDAPAAWAAAALWPVVPSALLFQPTADTAFPLLTASAWALAAWAARGDVSPGRALPLAALAGAILGLGMQFTLAFLPAGLIAGLLFATASPLPWRARLARVVATGAGFLAITLGFWALTSANPWAIWWHNQRNHARFYVEHPRSYLAWNVANLCETAVGLGLPVAAWLAVALGSARPRPVPRVAVLTLAVLAFLSLGGRSLSEVGRLWIPFFPPLMVLAAAGWDRLGGGPKTLAATVVLLGLQALALEAMIQVVYPI